MMANELITGRRTEATISTADAAAILGVTPRRMRALCHQRRIPGARLTGRDWHIPVTDGRIEIIPGTRGPNPRREPTAR